MLKFKQAEEAWKVTHKWCKGNTHFPERFSSRNQDWASLKRNVNLLGVHTPRLEITCKWNKNCTEKIMVPLKFLRKRSSRFGATCWGITTHQANRADGLCKYCKGLPHPSACASLWVVIPQHVAPNLELLFPNYFSGTYGISVQFFLIGPFFLTGCSVCVCVYLIPT